MTWSKVTCYSPPERFCDSLSHNPKFQGKDSDWFAQAWCLLWTNQLWVEQSVCHCANVAAVTMCEKTGGAVPRESGVGAANPTHRLTRLGKGRGSCISFALGFEVISQIKGSDEACWKDVLDVESEDPSSGPKST